MGQEYSLKQFNYIYSNQVITGLVIFLFLIGCGVQKEDKT